MKNFKKLSRGDLRKVNGGRACSIAIQGSDGSWTTRNGTCETGALGNSFCQTGLGNIALTSNGGHSRCND